MGNCRILLKCLIVYSVILSTHPQSRRERERDKEQKSRKEAKAQHVPTQSHHPQKTKQQQVEPCHANYHRTITNEPRRSYNYRFGTSGPREHAICDRDLIPGWYRFQSLAGDNIPTSCPGINYCGTRAPVWMKGTIPNVEDGIIKATACVSVQGKCCTTQIPILVKNCSDFTVYHLQPTPACPSAYCAGYEVTCPPGLSSDTGYTPCHFPVDLLETKVSYSLSDDKTQINFFCDVTLGGQVVPETVGLQVEWLADDEVIQSETFGLLQQHKGVLKEEKWTIGQTLQCRARAKHMTINTFTSPLLSKPINTGVIVLSSPTLSVTEGSEPAYVEFQTTIPIVCPKKEKPKKKEKEKEKQKKEEEKEKVEEEEECCVNFEIALASSTTPTSPRCATGNNFDLGVTSACSYKVCADEWNTTHRIPVWAVNDGLFGGDVGESDSDELRPSVAVDIRTVETGTPPRWHDLVLPTQEINIYSSDSFEVCSSGTLTKTFDGIVYENSLEGTFIMYKHTELPYEVQIHRKRCTYARLCNCGFAVRFGDVMVAGDICTTGKLRFWSYTLDGSYIEPAKMSHLPQIIRLDEGRSFEIQLPTGTTVTLGHNLRVISIQASSLDLDHTSGLCGSYDRDYSNEFSTYKGQTVCGASLNKTNSCPDFTKSWRLLTEQSLFVGSFTNDGHAAEDETDSEDASGRGHCSCSGSKKETNIELRPKSKSSYSASPYDEYQPENEQTEEDNKDANKCYASRCVDPRGAEITVQFLDLLSEEDFLYEGDEFGTVDITSQLQPVFYGQTKFGLPSGNDSQISDDAAEVYCRGVIEGMSFTKLCRDLASIDIEYHIKKCQTEVTYTKTTIWSFDALEEVRMQCKYQIYHNVSTWEPQLGRQHGTPPLSILSSLCLNGCSGEGTCEHGVCRCKRGFGGADCSVDVNAAPKITGVGFKNICDIRNKACSEVLVLGERFADSENIKCYFDVYTTTTAKAVPTLSSTVTSNGKLLTFQSIICDIPDLPVHEAKIASFYIPGEGLEKTRALLRVKVSYGASSPRSEALDYTIYDSLCWNCDQALSCEAKPTQSCNVLSDPFGSSSDPFHTVPSFSSPSVGFAQGSSPIQFSPDSSLGFNTPPRGSHHPSFGSQLHPGLTNPCNMPRDTGPCRSDNLRYFFDKVKCRPFIYGGCHGNANNFMSEEECLTSCDKSKSASHNLNNQNHQQESAPSSMPFHEPGVAQFQNQSLLAQEHNKPVPQKCLLGNSPGPCDSEVVRYYYDMLAKKCRPFIYGGCLGNDNNFQSKDKCIKECEGV